MPTYYSDHFSKTGIIADTDHAYDDQIRVPAGIGHGRVRYKRAQVTAQLTANDVVRMMTFKSTDRLLELMLTTDGASGAGAVNIGFYDAGLNRDGGAVDANLLAATQSIASLTQRIDVFASDSVLTAGETAAKGLTLWEIANYGDASYTEAPDGMFDICFTCSTTFTTTASVLTLEAYYTSGD